MHHANTRIPTAKLKKKKWPYEHGLVKNNFKVTMKKLSDEYLIVLPGESMSLFSIRVDIEKKIPEDRKKSRDVELKIDDEDPDLLLEAFFKGSSPEPVVPEIPVSPSSSHAQYTARVLLILIKLLDQIIYS